MNDSNSPFLLGAVVLAFCVSSCGDSAPADSAELAEAKVVHEAIVAQSDSLHEVIAGRLGAVRDSLASAQAAGDSAAIASWTTLEQQLNTIDLQFHDWMQTMVEIPGHAHDHAHDHGDGEAGHEGHDHGDGEAGHEGHDHAHDHGAGASLEGMSDAQILEIQKELQSRLSAIEAELNGLGN
ncbi:MAG: hypothetical protein RJA19_289 [Bacteroidota bacterium]